MDFANLGVNIDSSDAARAVAALDQLADVGEQVERRIERSMNDVTESMSRAANSTGVSAERMERQTRASVSNLSYQITDIAQMLAVGQSPFILMMQQGDQVAGAMRDLAGNNGTSGIIAGVGMAIRNLVNPVTLATYAIIGLGAWGVSRFMAMLNSGLELEKQVKALSSTFKEFGSYVDIAAESIDKLAEKYGTAAAQARELSIALAENKRMQLQSEVDGFIGTNADPFGLSDTLKGLQPGVVADYFGLDRPFMVFTQEARKARDELDALTQSMIDATNKLAFASGLEEQTVALEEYLAVFTRLADADGQRTASEIERIDLMGQILDKMYLQIGAEERLAEAKATVAAEAGAQSQAIIDMQSQVLTSMQAVTDKVKSLIADAFSSSNGLGSALISGIIDGIKSMAGSLYDTVKDVAVKASNSFKSVLGIKSPSRVFREHGKDIGKGLEKGIEDSENGVMSAMEDLASGISDAVVGLFDGSLRSASDFIGAIKSTFKRALGDMVSMAISNPIRVAFGLSPMGLGSAASAATGGGGALGGASGLLSKFMGEFGTAGSGIFGALGGGTGFLGGLGNALSGGLGNAFNVFGNAAAAGGGLAASLGAAIPVLGAVALVVGFFKKKVTLLDNGFRITIDEMDTLVETFRKTKTTKFFGLSKKIRETFRPAEDEFADPVIAAVNEIFEAATSLADMIGVAGEDILENFTSQIKVSTKGMKDNEIQAAVQGAFEQLTEEIATFILYNAENATGTIENFRSQFALKGETSQNTLQRLAFSLQAVNDAWKLMDFTLREVSITGAGAAANLVNLVGGLDSFNSLSGYFYENFFSEAERRAKATQLLSEALAEFGETLPTSKRAYRDLLARATAEGDDDLAAALLKSASAFVFITNKANEFAKSTAQNTLFRSRAEQVFAQTSGEYQKAVETMLSNDDRALIREVVVAIREGDINQARLTSRLLAIEERRDLEPVV